MKTNSIQKNSINKNTYLLNLGDSDWVRVFNHNCNKYIVKFNNKNMQEEVNLHVRKKYYVPYQCPS